MSSTRTGTCLLYPKKLAILKIHILQSIFALSLNISHTTYYSANFNLKGELDKSENGGIYHLSHCTIHEVVSHH